LNLILFLDRFNRSILLNKKKGSAMFQSNFKSENTFPPICNFFPLHNEADYFICKTICNDGFENNEVLNRTQKEWVKKQSERTYLFKQTINFWTINQILADAKNPAVPAEHFFRAY
jgi:hypothetical protein